MSRPISTVSRRGLLAGVAVLALLTLGACGGSATPQGWTGVEDGWLAVDVREDWVDTGARAEWWTRSWQDDADESEATVQMLAAPTFGYHGGLPGQGVILAGAQVGGLEGFSVTDRTQPVDTDTLEVFRTDFTYGDESEELQGVLWVAADPSTKKTVAVQLTGPDLPDDVVHQVEQSIRVLDIDAEPTTA